MKRTFLFLSLSFFFLQFFTIHAEFIWKPIVTTPIKGETTNTPFIFITNVAQSFNTTALSPEIAREYESYDILTLISDKPSSCGFLTDRYDLPRRIEVNESSDKGAGGDDWRFEGEPDPNLPADSASVVYTDYFYIVNPDIKEPIFVCSYTCEVTYYPNKKIFNFSIINLKVGSYVYLDKVYNIRPWFGSSGGAPFMFGMGFTDSPKESPRT